VGRPPRFTDLAAAVLKDVFEEFGLEEERRDSFTLEVKNPHARVIVTHDPRERAVGSEIRPRKPARPEEAFGWTAPGYDLGDIATALGVPHEAPPWGPFTGNSVELALRQTAEFLRARCRPMLEGDFSLADAVVAAQDARVPRWLRPRGPSA
jgi:hypothetical protein